MALIKCPECGKEISDKSTVCIGCGYPLSDIKEKETEEPEFIKTEYVEAPNTILDNFVDKFCDNLGVKDSKAPKYRVEKNPKYVEKKKCPVCGSRNFTAYIDTFETAGKTKTRYTMNLNPFHPFTVLNKKEKVTTEPFSIDIPKFICNDCGKIFY